MSKIKQHDIELEMSMSEAKAVLSHLREQPPSEELTEIIERLAKLVKQKNDEVGGEGGRAMDDVERSEFVRYVAEAMSIYAWTTDVEGFLPAAQELLDLFRRLYHRDPQDYLEFERWSLSRTQYQKIAKGDDSGGNDDGGATA